MDWQHIEADLNTYGCAVAPRLLAAAECVALRRDQDPRDDLVRSRIVMARHTFGNGEYKYFHYMLPDTVAELHTTLNPHLAAIANRWNEFLGVDSRHTFGILFHDAL